MRGWARACSGGAFLVAVPTFVVFAVTGLHGSTPILHLSLPDMAGVALAGLGVVVYPLIAPLAGPGWLPAQVFGTHRDRTAVAALGVALLILRGWRLWMAAVVPILWCQISGLTLQALQVLGSRFR